MWVSTLELDRGLKKSCLSQGPAGGEMWAPVLGEVPGLSWYWAVDQKCWHFRRRPEKFRLEHAAGKERKKNNKIKLFVYFLGTNEQVHASNTKSAAWHAWPTASSYKQCFKKACWHVLHVENASFIRDLYIINIIYLRAQTSIAA